MRSDTPRRWPAGLTALALALGLCGLLPAAVAVAQTPGLVLNDAAVGLPLTSGTDATIIDGTVGPCAADTGADSVSGVVVGPGVFAANPPSRPDGLVISDTSTLGFSTTDPIPFNLRGNFKDFAAELGGTLVAGDYVLTIRCFNSFDQLPLAGFSATLRFSSPTAFTVVGAPAAGATPLPSAMPSAGATTPPSGTSAATTAPGSSATTSATSTSTTSGAATTTSGAATTTAGALLGSDGTGGTASGTTGPTGTLAYTGAPLDVILLVGAVLVGAGIALRRAGRPRGLRG